MSVQHPASNPAAPEPAVPLLSYQRADLESDARFNWCCWSRQTGKSFTKSLRRLLRGIHRRRTQIFLSAGERQSRELMLKTQHHCRALQIACAVEGDAWFEGTSSRLLRLDLPNGVRVIGLPANPTTARGFTGDVLLDEFAMHRDDRAIWAAIFPAILRDGGELDVASTPKGRDNLFAELRENEMFRHSTVTLHDAIAAGLDVNAEEIRRSLQDDELYQQEFCCAFLDEQQAFLTYEQIGRSEDPGLDKTLDVSRLADAGPLYCGMDIGRCRDLTVLWVLEAVRAPGIEGNRAESGDVLITRGVCELANRPFREQWDVLREVLGLRQLRRCCIDASGLGMALAEAAVEAYGSSRVEALVFTPSVKDKLATGLRRRVEEGRIRIPLDEAIRNDWHSVRRSVTAGGPARYASGRAGGSHADRFWAACLAVRAAGCAPGVVETLPTAPLRFARAGVW